VTPAPRAAEEGGEDGLVTTDPNLVRTAVISGKVIYWNAVTGERFAITQDMARVLERLRTPAPAAGLDHENGKRLDSLRRLGMILSAPGPAAPSAAVAVPRDTDASAPGLFGCPRMELTAALRDKSIHAVVVGMPYDVAVTGRPGARFGPQSLRSASRVLFRQAVPGDTTGMHDPVQGRRVLAGAGIADIGDITAADVHQRNGAAMDALEQITGAIAQAGRLPLVLGGDHSVALPACLGVLGTHTPLTILHFDAHPDLRAPREDDWHIGCHHGNFMSWLVGDPRVTRVVQFGVRQLTAEDLTGIPKVTTWPGTAAAIADPAEILATIPQDAICYLTVDVDCLDPLAMPSTGTPLPGGFSHPQLIALLELICGARHVVGMDFTEYLPEGNHLAGHVAADVLLRTLDAVLRRRMALEPGEADMTCALDVAWDERLAGYDFGPGQPMAPLRLKLTMELARAFGLGSCSCTAWATPWTRRSWPPGRPPSPATA
jgi:agmatinase